MTEAKTYPPVLDACCGSRMFWFDHKDGRALFVDKRRVTHEMGPRKTYPNGCKIVVDPDVQADFSDLPFPDGTFDHVVFDPPHMEDIGDSSYTALKYGKLIGDWRDMLRAGFSECFRVLRPGGTLIFKWCEYDVPVSEVLALTPEKPLYGHRSGKQSKTHWVAFLKPNVPTLRQGDGVMNSRLDDQDAFEVFAGCYPHEAHAKWPDRFWSYFQTRCPGVSRSDMERTLRETDERPNVPVSGGMSSRPAAGSAIPKEVDRG